MEADFIHRQKGLESGVADPGIAAGEAGEGQPRADRHEQQPGERF